MTSSTTDTTADTSPLYKRMEADCEEQRIYPVYRVLEDEYIHQHGAQVPGREPEPRDQVLEDEFIRRHRALPKEYVTAKATIDLEIQAKLQAEIEAESERDLAREEETEHRSVHREMTKQEAAEDERHMRAIESRDKSSDARWAEKYPRYVALLNERFTAELFKHIHDLEEKRTALCFSGGGIRSASFGLGIVQGLARYGMLDKFDYLSTVSGGGYLGSWLSAWIHRARMPAVITALKNEPEKRKLLPEPEPIRHLRSYSNYLNPQLGFLSADTWTLVAIVLRNLLLNWLVLIPIIMAALLLPRIVVAVVQMASRTGARVEWALWLGKWALWLGTFFGLAAIVYMGVARPSANRLRKLHEHRLNKQGMFLWLCLLPLSLSAIGLTSWWAWGRTFQGEGFGAGWGSFVWYGIKLHVAGYILYTLILIFKDFKFWWGRMGWKKLLEPLAVALIGLLWGLLSWWMAHSLFKMPVNENPVPWPMTELYACFAAPLFMAIFLLAVTLFVGITSQVTDDEDREWWARFGAWVLIVAVLWSVMSALVIFGPFGLMWLGGNSPVVKAILGALGGASGILTILGGTSAKTSSHPEENEKPGGLMSYVSALAAPVFALMLLIAFSLGTSALIKTLSTSALSKTLGTNAWINKYVSFADWDFANQYAFNSDGLLQIIHHSPLALLLSLAAVLVAVSLIMSLCVNVNKFSLHSMYRNRLVRAYLGASRPQAERRPNPFTGFDPYDNIAMHELRHHRDAPGELKRKLLHVVNICLNLTSGHNLAWQQRKAETFTVSPLHCGSFHLGYRKTEEYGGGSGPPGDGISLGTAVTISGAAASPNMGYHSSPALAFLMTLFNARLGWWLGNPGPAGNDRFRYLDSYKRSGPRFSLRPILAEALGHSDNTSPYVYLSDGGHFENLGLYEMVLRRAHLIVVADGSQDPQSRFEDLAGAVRKIRIDLGIPIDFIGGMPIYAKDDVEHKGQSKYFAIGLIRYSCADKDTKGNNAQDGVLIYLKPAITGGEPIDILNYASTSPAFPHESTADQSYTEQQLESYRVLGSHIIQTLCGPVPVALPLVHDAADNFVKRAFDQTPRQMQPTELAGRFNIPKMV